MLTPRQVAEMDRESAGDVGRWVVTLDISPEQWAGVFERPGRRRLLVRATASSGGAGAGYSEFTDWRVLGSGEGLVVAAHLPEGALAVRAEPAALTEAYDNGIWLAAFARPPRELGGVQVETVDRRGRSTPWDLWPDLPHR